jgi:hypothetical protein
MVDLDRSDGQRRLLCRRHNNTGTQDAQFEKKTRSICPVSVIEHKEHHRTVCICELDMSVHNTIKTASQTTTEYILQGTCMSQSRQAH